MRPTRSTIHASPPRGSALLTAYALGVSLSLMVSPTALRAQVAEGSGPAPAIASTGGSSGSSSAPLPQASHGHRTISNNVWSQAADSAQAPPAEQSPWTADRSLPDAGQLRPRYSSPDQTAPTAAAASSSPNASNFGPADGIGNGALTGQVVTASATTPVANGPEMSGASEPAFTQTSGGVQHIPLAPPSKRATGDKPQASGGTLQMVVSIVSSLLLVVGLFLGVAWCYRKTLGTSLAGGLPKQVVSILGRTSISARQQLVLVRFGSKLLLVSVIQGEARTLGEISDPLEVDQMLGQCESGQPGSISHSFKSLLHSEGA